MKFLDDVAGKSSPITSLPEKMGIDKHANDTGSAIEEPLQVTLPQTSDTSTGSEQSWIVSNASPSSQQQKKRNVPKSAWKNVYMKKL